MTLSQRRSGRQHDLHRLGFHSLPEHLEHREQQPAVLEWAAKPCFWCPSNALLTRHHITAVATAPATSNAPAAMPLVVQWYWLGANWIRRWNQHTRGQDRTRDLCARESARAMQVSRQRALHRIITNMFLIESHEPSLLLPLPSHSTTTRCRALHRVDACVVVAIPYIPRGTLPQQQLARQVARRLLSACERHLYCGAKAAKGVVGRVIPYLKQL